METIVVDMFKEIVDDYIRGQQANEIQANVDEANEMGNDHIVIDFSE